MGYGAGLIGLSNAGVISPRLWGSLSLTLRKILEELFLRLGGSAGFVADILANLGNISGYLGYLITIPKSVPDINAKIGEKSQTSQNQMQKKVERGQAPKDVDRVDPPHNPNDPGSKPHIHFGDDKAALNNDGTWHDIGKIIPKITNKIAEWILNNGWNLPLQ